MEEVSDGDTKDRQSITVDEVVCLILHEYPFTNISHFSASFKDGGLTEPQVETLYYEAIQRMNRSNAITASFHGYELSDSAKTSGTGVVKANELPPGISNPKTFVFGDPKEYESMSEDQKTQLTQEMMGNHQNWVNSRDKKSAVR